MATLQKFKLLATRCTVANSPTRSPTTSPIVHLRRRKTLGMFLTRKQTSRRMCLRDDISNESTTEKRSKELTLRRRNKLKDLLVSSPPVDESATTTISERIDDDDDDDEEERLVGSDGNVRGWGWRRRGGGGGSFRPLSAALRNRLLIRAWRPVLVTIPE